MSLFVKYKVIELGVYLGADVWFALVRCFFIVRMFNYKVKAVVTQSVLPLGNMLSACTDFTVALLCILYVPAALVPRIPIWA